MEGVEELPETIVIPKVTELPARLSKITSPPKKIFSDAVKQHSKAQIIPPPSRFSSRKPNSPDINCIIVLISPVDVKEEETPKTQFHDVEMLASEE